MKEVSTLMIYLILAKIGGKITAFRLQKTHSGLRGPQKMWFNDDNGGRKTNIEQLHIKV